LLGPDGQTLDPAAFGNEPGSVLFRAHPTVFAVSASGSRVVRRYAARCSAACFSVTVLPSTRARRAASSVTEALTGDSVGGIFCVIGPMLGNYQGGAAGRYSGILSHNCGVTEGITPALSLAELRRILVSLALTGIEGLSLRKPVVVRTTHDRFGEKVADLTAR
jgi:hypothetical protein